MKQKLKGYKGITLIALIITIIVLLILAVVAIAAIKGDGIISHAKNAKSQYSGAQKNEQSILQGYIDQLDESQLASKKVKDNLNKVLSTGGNITLEDDFGNKIKVPAGFKIITKTDTENTDLNYTAETIDVTKGIVAEDGEGNQFVWIPVGKIYTDTEKTEANAKTITLGRYSDFTKTNNVYTVAQNASDYETQVKIRDSHGTRTEDTTSNHNSDYKNSIAKNIERFCTTTLASGGYYIGRYEARVENYDASNISIENSSDSTDWTGYVAESGKELKLASKANSQVWNYVTPNKASSLCQSMYTNKPFESDLVNSYAWDTAIVFIQEFENSTYSQTIGESIDRKLSNKGLSILKATEAVDKQCNIYDMAGNCFEWSTETCSNASGPCTLRGGFCGNSTIYTSRRLNNRTTIVYDNRSFRPVLYM